MKILLSHEDFTQIQSLTASILQLLHKAEVGEPPPPVQQFQLHQTPQPTGSLRDQSKHVKISHDEAVTKPRFGGQGGDIPLHFGFSFRVGGIPKKSVPFASYEAMVQRVEDALQQGVEVIDEYAWYPKKYWEQQRQHQA